MWDIEVTDTFGGEANYCWVKRFQVKAKSLTGAIRVVARQTGYRFRKAWDQGAYEARYDACGACVCAFVTAAEEP